MRPIPLIGDVALQAVQRIRHDQHGGFAVLPVENLDGRLVQRRGRGSHVLELEGILHGDTAREDLATLQELAAGGQEHVFAADIASALNLHTVVIERFVAAEIAGHPNHYAYRIRLLESPELPPPATVAGPLAGGLGDFGLDDLGIDPGVLGDIAALGEQVAGAADAALDAVQALGGLIDAAAGLDVGNPVGPLTDEIGKLGGVAQSASGAVTAVVNAFLGES